MEGHRTKGVAEWFADYEQALRRLEEAAGAFDLNCAAAASAFAAMTAWHLGDRAKTGTHLRQAQQEWSEILSDNREDLGPRWQDSIVVEIALKEAREEIGDDPVAPGKPYQR